MANQLPGHHQTPTYKVVHYFIICHLRIIEIPGAPSSLHSFSPIVTNDAQTHHSPPSVPSVQIQLTFNPHPSSYIPQKKYYYEAQKK